MDRIGEIIQEEYRVERAVGEEELGSLYLAQGLRQRENERYALLLLREKRDAFEEQYRKVLGDLKRAWGLQTNLVRISAVTTRDGMPGFASQIVPGQRLDKYLRKGPVKVERALAIVLGLGRSLVIAHGLNLVHGDLRPIHVVLSGSDEAGAHAGQAALLWHSLYRLRPPVTVDSAPEWLMYRPRQDLVGEGRLSDAGTDVFALGAILYECLSGEPAFSGRYRDEVLIEKVLEGLAGGPPKLSARPETGLSAELAEGFDEILDSACAPELEQRPQSMAALVRIDRGHGEDARAAHPGQGPVDLARDVGDGPGHLARALRGGGLGAAIARAGGPAGPAEGHRGSGDRARSRAASRRKAHGADAGVLAQ